MDKNNTRPAVSDEHGRWRDISTAPRDAGSILVWCPERKNTYIVTASPWNDGWEHFAAGHGELIETPTMWMPRPAAAPATGKEE